MVRKASSHCRILVKFCGCGMPCQSAKATCESILCQPYPFLLELFKKPRSSNVFAKKDKGKDFPVIVRLGVRFCCEQWLIHDMRGGSRFLYESQGGIVRDNKTPQIRCTPLHGSCAGCSFWRFNPNGNCRKQNRLVGNGRRK